MPLRIVVSTIASVPCSTTSRGSVGMRYPRVSNPSDTDMPVLTVLASTASTAVILSIAEFALFSGGAADSPRKAASPVPRYMWRSLSALALVHVSAYSTVPPLMSVVTAYNPLVFKHDLVPHGKPAPMLLWYVPRSIPFTVTFTSSSASPPSAACSTRYTAHRPAAGRTMVPVSVPTVVAPNLTPAPRSACSSSIPLASVRKSQNNRGYGGGVSPSGTGGGV
mmetsp:Transcript_39168/g.80222  ORF Transcript_39168/g.80222 Transcript_39168/m.80222 type:complete len:222 (+) Transcript_39168:818-1483(+)